MRLGLLALTLAVAAPAHAQDAMAAARAALIKEHGGGTFSQIMVDIAEIRRHGFAWNGEAWIGGDIDRLVVKSEGEGRFGQRDTTAEVQAFYSHAIDAYWNLQAGIRQDFGTGPSRRYAAVAVEGLAPYWLEVEGTIFLSDKGDLLGRIELYHDVRITNRLIAQPRIEANLAAQDVPASQIGSGLSRADLGLRLRYEFSPRFAPYVGIAHERSFGDTARLVRAGGEGRSATRGVIGIRGWF